MRERNPMPDDILALLKSEQVLDDYMSRPAYQQNDYLGWISRAARVETRLKRINQMIEELRAGGVYMNMDHPSSSKK
jgi:uncharacterized protein YdeI (YjbR/CyaY-like superfamily)